MSDLVVLVLTIVGLLLAGTMVALIVYVRRLQSSVECLCSNIGGLRQQMGVPHEHGA